MTSPQYLYIDVEPTADSIRRLLQFMVTAAVSSETAQMFGILAAMSPSERLVFNLGKAAEILGMRKVRDVLKDGLFPDESASLMELDCMSCPDELRKTARSLLNVKERWIMSKCMSGLFNRARLSTAYIDIRLGGT